MMKYLIAILLLSLSGLVMAGDCPPNSNSPNCSNDWPGQVPDWDSRYSVGCTMTDNETGATSFEFHHGNADYAQAGSMIVYLQTAMRTWYEDLAALAAESGAVDMRLIPTPDSPLTQIIE
jgi:hypothetical protein